MKISQAINDLTSIVTNNIEECGYQILEKQINKEMSEYLLNLLKEGCYDSDIDPVTGEIVDAI